jgi:electron transport complex protein RnfA
MTMASIVTWLIFTYILTPTTSNLIFKIFCAVKGEALDPGRFNFVYILRTLTFILVIATMVQLVEMYIKKASPALYQSLGIYLPLIVTNCAVLGVALLNVQTFFTPDYRPLPWSFLKTILQGFGAGLGFTMALLLMSGIREKLDTIAVPEPLKGVPIAFICTGFMALAFSGFAGMV